MDDNEYREASGKRYSRRRDSAEEWREVAAGPSDKSDTAVRRDLGYKSGGSSGSGADLEMTQEERAGGLAGAAAFARRKRAKAQNDGAKEALAK